MIIVVVYVTIRCLMALKNFRVSRIATLIFASACGFFYLYWLVNGTMMIFVHFEPDYVVNPETYCHKSLFLFAFGATCVVYVLTGLAVGYFVISCCIKEE